MHPVKYYWAFKTLLYKPFYKKIGFMTYMGRPLYVEGKKNIEIGNRTRILPGLRIEALNDGSIQIGNNCVIEQNVHIISEGQILKIGDDTTISANAFISNVDHDYSDINKSVMDQSLIRKHTEIGEGCFIGFGAVILPGTKLGKHCVVGSNAVIKGEFPDYCVIVGAPGKIVKKYSIECGEWRNEIR